MLLGVGHDLPTALTFALNGVIHGRLALTDMLNNRINGFKEIEDSLMLFNSFIGGNYDKNKVKFINNKLSLTPNTKYPPSLLNKLKINVRTSKVNNGVGYLLSIADDSQQFERYFAKEYGSLPNMQNVLDDEFKKWFDAGLFGERQ